MLTLAALGHPEPETLDDLRGIAADVDADDSLLRSEIESLVDAPFDLVVQDVASRVEASWGADAAFDELMRGRFRLAPARLNRGVLAQTGVLFLASTIRALAAEVGASRVIDSTGHLDDIALELGSEANPLAVSIHGNHPVARLTRRRLVARGCSFECSANRQSTTAPLIAWRTPPAADHEAAMAALSEALLNLSPEVTAVVVGPASLLLDALPDRALQTQRADLVRDPRFRYGVRLPRGLVTSSPRQHLAVLVFSGSSAARPVNAARPDLVRVADLDEVALTPGVSERLVDDIVASLSPNESGAAHKFAYGSWAPRARVVARSRSLIPAAKALARVSPSRPRQEANAASALAVAQSTDALGPSVREAVSGLEPSLTFEPKAQLVLGDLADQGIVLMYPGTRIQPEDIAASGVPLISNEDVRQGSLRIDRAVPVIVQQGTYPRATLTRPGDVIVVPQPAAALIDRRGRSLVEAPARILRVVDGTRVGLTPELVAGAINGAEQKGVDWRRWAVPPAPLSQRDRLGTVLEALHERRLQLRLQLDQLESAQQLLTDGVRDSALFFTRTTPDTDLEGGA